MALIPEDRKTEGLLLPMSVADNLAIASLDHMTSGLFVNADAMQIVHELHREASGRFGAEPPPDEYVFINRQGNKYTVKRMTEMLRTHSDGEFTAYDMRRLGAQRLIDLGEEPAVVGKLMGQDHSRMVWEYAELKQTRRREAASKLTLRRAGDAG